MKRYILPFLVTIFILPSLSSGGDLYEEQLDRGIRNSEPYSYLLINLSKTDTDKEKARSLLQDAQKYSPDLPATYFEIAKNRFTLSPHGMFEAVDYMLQGIAAYKRNFWWSFMMMSSVLTSAILSFLVSILILIIIRLPQDLPLLSHDIREEKAKIFLLLLLLGALFGPLFLLGGLLLLISFYQKKWDRLILSLYIAFVLVSPWIFKTVSMIFYASASGTLKAVVQVNESKDNTYALSLLSGSQKPVEIFSYALALKREGRYHDAIDMNTKLIGMKPDARTYINLANNYVAINNPERAIDLYKKSLERAQLPSAYYNLSQVYRETLDFDKGEEFFLSAQKLDHTAVSQYRAIYSRNPNRFVIDEDLPMGDIYEYAKTKTKGSFTGGLSYIPLFMMPLIGVFFALLYYSINKRFKTWAYRCSRCGKILCTKCEKHILWGHMCFQCYGSLIKLDELDAKERITRLLTVYDYQNRRRNMIKILSLAVPGWGLIYGGNVLYGFLFLWIFLFSIFVLIMNSFFVIEMSRFSHVWLNVSSMVLLVVIYLLSNAATRRRLAKGWL
jgi:tetratricopeptide (TPR) repeat protein